MQTKHEIDLPQYIPSPESRVHEEIDLTSAKELINKSQAVIDQIAEIARSMKHDLLQNEVHITSPIGASSKGRKLSLRMLQNGISAKEYNYYISIRNSPISLSIGGTIPINEEQEKINDLLIESPNNSTPLEKPYWIHVLPKGSVLQIKGSLGENKDTKLATAFKAIENTIKLLEDSQYDTKLTPREGDINETYEEPKEAPYNLN